MSGEIKLDIGADTRGAVKGVDNLGEALGDVVDDLEKVDREADDASDAMVRAFRKAGDAADKAGKDVKTGLTKPLKEAGDEAGASGREAAASFGGGFEDVADFVQETLANALGGFGPLGAAAGVALAAVLGTVLANAQAAQEKLSEAREKAIDLSRTLYENEGKLPLEDAVSSLFDLLADEIRPNGPIQSMLDGFVDFGSRVDSVKDSANDLRIPLRNVATALSGTDLKESERVLGLVNDKLETMKSNVGTAWVWQTGPLEDMKTQLETTIETARIADEALGVVGSAFDSQAYRDQVAAIGTAWENAMIDAGNYVSEADGVTTFDWSAYLTDAETTLAAANEYKRKILTVPPEIRSEAESIFASQGAKAASSYLGAYETSSSADRERFRSAARQNGEAAGKAQGEAFAKEAEATAQAKAQGWGPLKMPVKPEIDDYNVRNYRPPTVYIPGVIVKPGTRQPI